MEIAEWFEIVRKSQLVDASVLSIFQERLASCSDVQTISAKMVKDGLLSPWQSEKLLAHRWKGFFVDTYCITNNLGADQSRGLLVLEAMDMKSRAIVVLEAIPPAKERRKDGGLIYSVRGKAEQID